MAKIADKYFIEDPWKIIEEGFDPEYAQVAESIFSQANEYMGTRGCLDEGYSGEQLIGSYFNGIYERKKQGGAHYKGVVEDTEFMVNAVNWVACEIYAGEEKLDLAVSSIDSFRRELDMKSGLLTRSFVWNVKSGGSLKVTFERIISMNKVQTAATKVTFTSLSYEGKVKIVAGMDCTSIHVSAGRNLWAEKKNGRNGDLLELLVETVQTKQSVYSALALEATGLTYKQDIIDDKKISAVYEAEMKKDCTAVLTRKVYHQAWHSEETEEFFLEGCKKAGEVLADTSYEKILEENIAWWAKKWQESDVEIKGDQANQQGIRFCIFQLFQTYQGAVKGSNIGAKGLTGEAYNGNAFWDTETYCLPFYIFNDMEGAKNLLYFRYKTLPEARERAKDLDCRGAFYPIATISGRECCNLWQHASLQLQASTAVAYGLWFYEKMTADMEFIADYGLEMLIEICRMLATRGDYSNDGSKYGFYNVMGPDEFQMMVNHNCYTNYMGRFTFLYTIETLKKIQEMNPEAVAKVSAKIGFTEKEAEDWKKKADCMYIPYDEETGLYEQHEGFFELPHIDVDAIPVEEFPLYSHWSYDRIYRNDMIKQPDVLMLMLLFNSSFTENELKSNYEYYEPRCIHESSLSPSVHSILASQLKKRDEAYDFFGFATRLDLDNYNRNTEEGIHTTSIAAAWMNIVYGFGGLRSDGEQLSLNPVIPFLWDSYSFRLHCDTDVLVVEVEKDKVTLSTVNGGDISILLYGKEITAGKDKQEFVMPEEWRG